MGDELSTLSAVASVLDRVEQTVTVVQSDVKHLISTDSATQVRLDTHEARIADLEDWRKWALRMTAGLIVSSVSALIAAVIAL